MNVLETMTGATPECRLLLLKWAFQYGDRPVIGDMKDLSIEFQMPKAIITKSLCYLVQEGYMKKYPNTQATNINSGHRPRFGYQLTPDCSRIFNNTHRACYLKDELQHALCDTHNPSLSKRGVRLLWACFVLLVNEAGYVLGYETEALKKMLGMTDKQFIQNIMVLQQENIVVVVAADVACSDLFAPLPNIYKLSPHSDKLRLVEYGVPVQGDHLTQFDFLREVIAFNVKFKKQLDKQDKYILQSSTLSDEQYFEMSKYFIDARLPIYIHHLCLSIIFSTLLHETIFAMPLKQTRSNVLGHLIRTGLVQGLRLSELMVEAPKEVGSNIDELETGDVSAIRSIDFILDKLTDELIFKIIELSQYLRPFAQAYGGKMKLIHWLPRACMFAELINDEANSDNPSLKPPLDTTRFVLSLWLPAAVDARDSMFHYGKILSNNPLSKNSNIVQVNKIFSLSAPNFNKVKHTKKMV